VLVDHRVDDVDERLVAGEQTVPAGEEVALEPPLAGVLGEDFHHPAVGGEVVVALVPLGHPGAVGDLEDGAEPVRVVLVGREDPEGRHVAAHDVPQESAEHASGPDRAGAGRRHLDGVVAPVGHP
jgi:hypothetical protein